MQPSMIIDILLVAVVVLAAIKAYRDGFVTAIINLLGNIVALVGGWIVAKQYSPVVFDSFFRASAVEKTYTYLQDSANAVDVQQIVDTVAAQLPGMPFVEELKQSAQEILAGFTTPTMEMAQSVVDTIVAPVVTVVINIVMFLVIFAVCCFVFSLLAKLFKALNKVPVLGFANRLAGFAVGIATGAIYVILISCLLSIIAVVTKNTLPFLNMDILAQSKVLEFTQGINPFVG